jgi:anti-sigma regulatory factor (Ser/Thr protein kinase)
MLRVWIMDGPLHGSRRSRHRRMDPPRPARAEEPGRAGTRAPLAAARTRGGAHRSSDEPTAAEHAIELPRSTRAAGLARDSLATWFQGELDQGLLYRAQLVCSELATNAFLHGRGTILLRADLDEDRLMVEVIDEGEGFERRIRAHELDALGGRGLAIVDAEATRWGIHEGTTHIWFELELPGPRLGSDERPH